ncbi:MAG: aminodeoxychorismate synthase component I [Alphaproteobacteria bacterium]|jgi:para-aminobenzoate synthetase component I|nr:aminodeoxychorismate synthase component I [Alphaproteobacteria bacterium]MBT7944426.1 aminodeoxychorismate synthase component I [Alphaproteobacteria bacterium]
MIDRPYIIPLTYRDPMEAFTAFDGDPVTAFLDSAAEAGGRGRYAYIASDPYRVISTAETNDPFEELEAALKPVRVRNDPRLPPFQGGAVGLFGYELGCYLEKLPAPKGGFDTPDMVLGLYDTVAAFDTQAGKAWIVAHDIDGDIAPARPPKAERAQALARRISDALPLGPIDWTAIGAWTSDLSRSEYEAMVARVIDYIHAGDIFQANVSQRLLADMPDGLSPMMLYRRLRALSPAPFGAFFRVGDMTVVSASPERFLSLNAEGYAVSRPIKGTRPRGRTPEDDEALANALLASEKDQAENLMIVDLMRNDLSRVCRLGSVGVSELAGLESFANVHHLVSEVRGTLFPNLGPVDLLRATFPGGSITGAPKIRAMEIINELEPVRRGPYCGSIAWIGFDGAMDSSIVIRTLVVKGGQVAAQAGGGIVADSDPAAEFDETMDKAWALLQSIDPGDLAREQAW